MKVKKYTGETMQDVVFQVKADLGSEAVIINKRKYKKGGIFGFFGREVFEVVAALESKNDQKNAADNDELDVVEIANYTQNSKKRDSENIQKTADKDPENKNAIKEFINDLKSNAANNKENLAHTTQRANVDNNSGSAALNQSVSKPDKEPNKKHKHNIDKFKEHLNTFKEEDFKAAAKEPITSGQNSEITAENHSTAKQDSYQELNEKNDDFKNNKEPKKAVKENKRHLSAEEKLQHKFQGKVASNQQNKNLNNSNQLYNYLLDQGVDSRNLNLFLKKLNNDLDSDSDEKFELKLKSFLNKYFEANQPIVLDSKQKLISFIGPTGVGKTTTMAKIAADFAINQNKNVGLITADTYRIAAVEQLQTYSKIIDIPFAVCYSGNKLREMISGKFSSCDLILIDTPGSSWKDDLQLDRLESFVDRELVDEVHLLLSLNTKSSDLRSIVNKFAQLKADKVLFTKLDETSSYGDIINIRENYNFPISYLTFGQDVPEDLEIATADKIFKYLFGDLYA